MSNTPVQFKRNRQERNQPRLLDIEGAERPFRLQPKLSSRLLPVFAAVERGSLAAVEEVFQSLILDGDDDEPGAEYARFLDLDFDMGAAGDMMALLEHIGSLYGMAPGEAEPSSTPTSDDGGSSSPTSSGSTDSTSTTSGSALTASGSFI